MTKSSLRFRIPAIIRLSCRVMHGQFLLTGDNVCPDPVPKTFLNMALPRGRIMRSDVR